MEKNWKCLLQELYKAKVLILSNSIQQNSGSTSQSKEKRKRNSRHSNWKRSTNIFACRWQILYVVDPRDSTHTYVCAHTNTKLLELTLKSCCFCKIQNKQGKISHTYLYQKYIFEKEIKKTNPMVQVSWCLQLIDHSQL